MAHKKTSSKTNLFPYILGVGLVLTIVFCLFLNKNQGNQGTVNGDTKIYTNNTLGYSTQIPSNWETEGEGSFLGIPGEATFFSPTEKSKNFSRTVIAITTMTTGKVRYSLNTQKQFNEWKVKTVSDGKRERLYKIANVKIDGIDGVQFISRALPGDRTEAFYSIVTWFRKDNANYYIELGPVEDKVLNYKNIYDQVILNFKFLPKK